MAREDEAAAKEVIREAEHGRGNYSDEDLARAYIVLQNALLQLNGSASSAYPWISNYYRAMTGNNCRLNPNGWHEPKPPSPPADGDKGGGGDGSSSGEGSDGGEGGEGGGPGGESGGDSPPTPVPPTPKRRQTDVAQELKKVVLTCTLPGFGPSSPSNLLLLWIDDTMNEWHEDAVNLIKYGTVYGRE